MADRNPNDQYLDSADDAAKREELPPEQDALSDQDLDQAAGGLYSFKSRDAGSASDWQGKNDKPESDAKVK